MTKKKKVKLKSLTLKQLYKMRDKVNREYWKVQAAIVGKEQELKPKVQ